MLQKAVPYLVLISLLACKVMPTSEQLAGESFEFTDCFPQLRSQLIENWEQIPGQVELIGFSDENTFEKAQRYAAERMPDAPNWQVGRVILAEAYGRGFQANEKKWLIAYADHKLMFFDQAPIGDRQPISIIFRDLTVHRMILSADSNRLVMITGDRAEEALMVGLDRIRGGMQEFVALRERDVLSAKNSMEFYRGFAHQLFETTKLLKNRQHQVPNIDGNLIREVFDTEFFNPSLQDLGSRMAQDVPILSNGSMVIGGPFKARRPDGGEPYFRKVTTAGEVTAFGHHFYDEVKERPQWYFAERLCHVGFDSQEHCAIHIKHQVDATPPTQIWQEVLPVDRRHESVTALAVSDVENNKRLFAFYYQLSEISNDGGGRLIVMKTGDDGALSPVRSFIFPRKVRSLRFLRQDAVGSPKLLVATEANDQHAYTVLHLNAIMNPLEVAEFGASQAPIGKLPQDDRRGVYGLAIRQNQACGDLIAGGADGQAYVIESRGSRQELLAGNESSAIVNIALSPDSAHALIVQSSGNAKYFNFAGSEARSIDLTATASTEFDIPESAAATAPKLRLAQILQDSQGFVALDQEGQLRFYDQNGYPTARKLDEVSEVRLSTPSADNKNHRIVSLSANAPLLRLPQLYFVANDRGWIINANITQRSGGEYHLISVNENAKHYVPLSLNPTPDGEWLLVAGFPEAGSAGGLLRRYNSSATASGTWSRYDHCHTSMPPSAASTSYVDYRGHTGAVTAVVSGKINHEDRIISAGLDGRVISWRLLDPCSSMNTESPRDPKLLRILEASDGLTSLAVNRDGRYVAAGTLNGKVLVWWNEDPIRIH